MEWVVVKGISGYADGTGGVSDEWKTFASVMAASVVENMSRLLPWITLILLSANNTK